MLVNTYADKDFAPFIEHLTKATHRTLQQKFMGVICRIIKEQAAKGEGEYDARNEATVQLCRKIVEKVGADLDYLPFI
jgi:hypothetical protein